MKYEILSDERMAGERVIKVRVDGESVEEVWAEEVGRMATEFSVPGFRKGKAPPGVVERHVGRDSIWRSVREVVASRVSSEIIRDAEPKPLAPPTFDFGDGGKEPVTDPEVEEASDGPDRDEETGVGESSSWDKGEDMVYVITYLLPPPSPEEIERDLLRRSGVEKDEGKKAREENHKSSGTMPSDPRSVIPGSGIPDED